MHKSTITQLFRCFQKTLALLRFLCFYPKFGGNIGYFIRKIASAQNHNIAFHENRRE
jgi:hypothetical protein